MWKEIGFLEDVVDGMFMNGDELIMGIILLNFVFDG